jgi:hypothetical protein
MNPLLFLLENYIDQIREEMGADWPEFAADMQKLAPAFAAVQDEIGLAQAVGELYMVCRSRKPVMAIFRQAAEKHGIRLSLTDRRVPAGGASQPDEILIRETANRFQSLLDNLDKIKPPAQDSKQSAQNTNPSIKRTL